MKVVFIEVFSNQIVTFFLFPRLLKMFDSLVLLLSLLGNLVENRITGCGLAIRAISPCSGYIVLLKVSQQNIPHKMYPTIPNTFCQSH